MKIDYTELLIGEVIFMWKGSIKFGHKKQIKSIVYHGTLL